MIVRIVVIDPKPKDVRDDTVVYQVPEHSRAHELLIELLEAQGIEFVTVESNLTSKRRRTK